MGKRNRAKAAHYAAQDSAKAELLERDRAEKARRSLQGARHNLQRQGVSNLNFTAPPSEAEKVERKRRQRARRREAKARQRVVQSLMKGWA